MAKQEPSLDVSREGRKVTLIILCSDEYAAMKIYDEIVAGAEEGGITLELETC